MTTAKATKATKKAAPKKQGVTSASDWKKQTTAGIELEVPSGNTCRVKRPDGMRLFMERGMVPNALMPLVEEALSGKKIDVAALAEEAIKDTNKVKEMIGMIDAVVVDTVIEPVVAPIPTDENGNVIPWGDPRRDDSVLYVDEVDASDKQFIFNFAVGGTKDLESFREEQAAAMANLAAVEDVDDQAE